MSHTVFQGKIFNVATALLLLSALGGAAQNSSQEPTEQAQPAPTPQNPTPQTTPTQPPPQQPQQQVQGAGAPVDSNAYKVGPADILNIRVWNEAEFSGPVAVHDDGMITLPLVGDLQAGGKTPNEIQQIVAKALAKYVVKPLVTITVQSVESKKYYIDGLIAKPGEYPLITPTTVFQAISRAGGLQEFANGKKIYVLRGSERIHFNYKEVIHGKNLAQDIQLQPGDHIVVP
jgi:polysaccharide export outer membrane protein